MDAADAPAAGELEFNRARRHTIITQRDSPRRQEAGRRAFRPLQDIEEKGAGEAPLTYTKNGIIGMRATVAALTCQSGTPAQRVRLQDMEEKGAGEAPLTYTKYGIIGMRVIVAALTCQSGTPAQRVRRSAARRTIRRDTHGAIVTNMWVRDGTPAG